MNSGASPRPRLIDRIGIVPRLLICSLLAVLLTAISVELWTLRLVNADGIQRTQDSLRQSAALLKLQLAPLGAQWSIGTNGNLMLGTTPLNGRNDIVDTVKSVTGAAATIFQGDTRIATNVANPDGSRGIGTKLARGPVYDTVLRDGRSFRGEAWILGVDYLTLYEPIRDVKDQIVGILFVGVPQAQARAFLATIVEQAALGTLLIATLTSLAYLLALRIIVRPISGLAGVMHRIADGALDTGVHWTERTDHIGEMARALRDLRDTSARARELEAAAAAERRRADEVKHAALLDMADRIESDTAIALRHIGGRTASMAAAADDMSASAVRTGQSAEAAATAAGQALANAQTVTQAADQLAAAIREISAQVGQSTAVVNRAVAAGSETRTSIDTLNNEVERIGKVVDIINEIAARTNLLALNATIEAARAGDAGKGFAVVAAEVKALASQTARSTEEIGQLIGQVRAATGASVAAVARIEQTITEVNEIAGSIAAAVEQQGAATAEIARNVAETTAAAETMTGQIREVSAEATRNRSCAAEVRDNTTGLNGAVEELRRSVIRVVRTSTEADRRQSPRHAVAMPCVVSLAGHDDQAGQVTELSEGGACIAGIAPLPAGAQGTLRLPGPGLRLPFTVGGSDGGAVRVGFRLRDDEAAGLRRLLDGLPASRAA
jgi:methyl-accepting chemotaxis protein